MKNNQRSQEPLRGKNMKSHENMANLGKTKKSGAFFKANAGLENKMKSKESHKVYTKEVREPLRGPEKSSVKIFTKVIVLMIGIFLLFGALAPMVSAKNFNITSNGENLFYVNGSSGDASFGFNVTAGEDFCLSTGLCLSSLDGITGTMNSTAWNRSGTNVFLANVGDNVGIGTTAPNKALEVSSTAGETIRLNNPNSAGGYIGFSNAGTEYGEIGAGNWLVTGGTETDLAMKTNANILFATGGITERMRITNGGNVGIGTTTPLYKLQITGAATDSSKDMALIDYGSGSWSINNYAGLAFGTNGVAYNRIATYPDAASSWGLSFYTTQNAGGSVNEKMRITSAGNVGIGTTAPGAYKLNVNGSTYVNGAVYLKGTNSYIDSDGNSLYLKGTGSTYLNTANTAYVTAAGGAIFNGGNVGIGTTSPQNALDVVTATSDGSSSTNGFRVRTSQADTPQSIHIGANDAGAYGWIQAREYSVNTAALSLNPHGGNVGIGTTNPGAKLDIYHDVANGENAILKITASGGTTNSNLAFATNGGTGLFQLDYAGNMVFRNYQSGLYFDNRGSGDIFFRTTSSNSNRLTIKNGGNVGIGTTSPQNKLNVLGDANVTGHCVAEGTLISVVEMDDYGGIKENGELNSGLSQEEKATKNVENDEIRKNPGLFLRQMRGMENLENDEGIENSNYKVKQIPVEEVKSGDYVLSLNESSGEIEPAKVNELLDMGHKPIYELVSESGKAINTTVEHPYLVKLYSEQDCEKYSGDVWNSESVEFNGDFCTRWISVGELKEGMEIAVEGDNLINSSGNNLIGLVVMTEFSENNYVFFNFEHENETSHMDSFVIAEVSPEIFEMINSGDVRTSDLINFLLNGSEQSEVFFLKFNESFFNLSSVNYHIESHQELNSSIVLGLISPDFILREVSSDILTISSTTDSFTSLLSDLSIPEISSNMDNFICSNNWFTTLFNAKVNSSLNSEGISNLIVISSMNISDFRDYLSFSEYGKTIFEKITEINRYSEQQVYDLAIEGTHNFIANGIVAHNTYVGGSLNATTDVCIEGGVCLSGMLASGNEVDPKWTGNYSAYNASWTTTDAEIWNIAGNGTLAYNSSLANYYLKSNPFAFYNSTTLPAVTDVWVNASGDTMTGNLVMGGTSANIALGSNWLSGDGGDEGVFVGSTGNVGIGTSSPATQFHVSGSAPSSYVAGRIENTGLNGAADFDYTNDARTWKMGVNTVDDFRIRDDTGGNNVFIIEDGSSANSLYVKSGGKVGINTASPNEELDVRGAIQAQQIIANGTGTHPTGIGSYLELYMLGDVARILPYDGSSYKDLAIGDYGGGNPNIMLKVGGNVGIGDGTPDYRLDVAGDVNAYRLLVNGSVLNSTSIGAVTGSGTSGYIPVWNGTSSLNNSVVYQNGTNVGIGTASPSSTTEIYTGASNNAAGLVLSQGGANSGRLFFTNDTAGTGFTILKVSDRLSFTVDSTPGVSSGSAKLSLLSSGNVGIGTTSPAGKFDVQDGTGTQTAGDLLVDSVGHNVYVGQLDATAGNTNLIVRDRVGNVKLTVPGAQSGHISMATVGAGNVGIGTTSPDYKLQVVGVIEASSLRSAGAVTFTGKGALQGGIAGADIEIYSNDDLQFSAGGAGTNSLVIKQTTGNVGIGTTSPQQKLHVAGNAVFNGTINMDSNKIISLANGTSAQDAATYSQLMASIGSVTESDPYAYNGTLAYNSSLANYYLKSNPFGFYNSTTLPAAGAETDPYWTGNSTLVPYLASANTFTNNNVFNGNLTVGTNVEISKSLNDLSDGIITMNGGRFIWAPATNNLFVGEGSGKSGLSGDYNTGIGTSVLTGITTGSSNVALGSGALLSLSSGSDNIGIGYNSINGLINGNSNVGIGTRTLTRTNGGYNTAVGANAGDGTSGGLNQMNSFFGYKSGYAIRWGDENVFLGYKSGENVLDGSRNILIGSQVNGSSLSINDSLNIGNLIYGDMAIGRVGIGTLTPQQELDVMGNLNVTGNATVERVVFENNAGHYIEDNSTCIKIQGSTSLLEIC